MEGHFSMERTGKSKKGGRSLLPGNGMQLLDAHIYKCAMRQCSAEFFPYSSPERVIDVACQKPVELQCVNRFESLSTDWTDEPMSVDVSAVSARVKQSIYKGLEVRRN